jgi:hypothetical protein
VLLWWLEDSPELSDPLKDLIHQYDIATLKA